jgi:hypothetical protein
MSGLVPCSASEAAAATTSTAGVFPGGIYVDRSCALPGRTDWGEWMSAIGRDEGG